MIRRKEEEKEKTRGWVDMAGISTGERIRVGVLNASQNFQYVITS